MLSLDFYQYSLTLFIFYLIIITTMFVHLNSPVQNRMISELIYENGWNRKSERNLTSQIKLLFITNLKFCDSSSSSIFGSIKPSLIVCNNFLSFSWFLTKYISMRDVWLIIIYNFLNPYILNVVSGLFRCITSYHIY